LFLGDIFKEKVTKTHTATTAKRETPASTQVVDIFDDPLNASDV